MRKLHALAITGALLAALGLSAGSLLLAYMNRPLPPAPPVAPADLTRVAGIQPDAAAGDRVVALTSAHQGGNTEVDWLCGKTKISGARAEDHFGHWNGIGGAVAYNPKAARLKAVEIRFATASFAADADLLTRTVVYDQQWFDTEKWPEAAFTATEFVPRSPALEKELADAKANPVDGWTHVIRGRFTLNGIPRPLSIAAKVAVSEAGARIAARFALSRAEFKVDKRRNSLATLVANNFVVDDAVQLSVHVTASPDLAILVAELGARLQAQKADDQAMRELLKNTSQRVTALENQLDKLASRPAVAAAPAATIRLADLPGSFDDAITFPPLEKDYKALDSATGKMESRHHSFPGFKSAPFRMIRVPGDPAKGVAPFYIGETEVTWNLFKTWSHSEDVPATDAEAETERKLRPSNAPSHADVTHGAGYAGRPAMGMTRLAAEKFCLLLSQKTGRHYRLPTEAEWDLAYRLGGGDPRDKLAAAWCRENAPTDADDPEVSQNDKTFSPRACPVKTKAPNRLGLYDMLGNVAEWVDTGGQADGAGKKTFVRGGDFTTPLAQLSGSLREESDNEYGVPASWNFTYPQNPTSIWWYKDHFQVGFRLVCDPVNLPKP